VNTGANLVLYGSTHATQADDFQIRNATDNIIWWDASTAGLKFFSDVSSGENPQHFWYGYKTGVGAKYGYVTVATSGAFYVGAQEALRLFTGAGESMFLDCGGTFYLRDLATVNRFTVASATGNTWVGGDLEIDGVLNHDGASVGLFGVTPVGQHDLNEYSPSGITECEAAILELQDLLIALGPCTYTP